MRAAATVRVRRPCARLLVVTRPRGGALVRIVIWLAIVGGFYLVLLGGAGAPAADGGARWLLLLVPLFLLPYLVDGLRVLVRGDESTFDADTRLLRRGRDAPVPFEHIRHLELSAVNGGCEEVALSARLTDGRALAIVTGERIAPMLALAEDAAALVGVPVQRRL